jgi:hypothetical protein
LEGTTAGSWTPVTTPSSGVVGSEASTVTCFLPHRALIADEDFGEEDDYPYDASPETYLSLALQEAAVSVGHTVGQLCRPTLRFTGSAQPPDVDPASIESAWRFESLIGVAYLQMYWLMTSGGNITRCEYCGQLLSLAKTQPDGRKRRRDKRFCDDTCRQGHHRSKKRPAGSLS